MNKRNKLDNQRKKQVLSRLLTYFKPYRKKLFLVLLVEFINSFVILIPNLLVGKILDLLGGVRPLINTLTYEIVPPNLLKIFIILGSYIVVMLIATIAVYKKNMFMAILGERIILDIREEVFTHIETMDQAQLNKMPVGKMVTRTINDTNNLNYFYSFFMGDLLFSLTTWVLYLIAMFYLSYVITLYMLIFAAVSAGLVLMLRVFSRKIYLTTKDKVSDLNSFLSENLSGIKVTQVFNQEENKINEFKLKNESLKSYYIKGLSVHAILRPILYMLTILGQITVFVLTIKYINSGHITYGAAFSFFALVGGFFWPIESFSDQFDFLQSSLASGDKIFEILDNKPKIVDKKNPIELKEFKGNIEFKNVWFKYADNYVLEDVSFKINPNETMAIVGPTGAGKTTILNLIVKNYVPEKGEILLDGININDLSAKSIRHHIGQMLQDVFLFEGTVYDNLTFGNSNITRSQVNQALEYVGATGVIKKLPHGLDTIIYERGNNFSQGERQLLSFARVILYKPSVMFLDEATANIDSETEVIIQNSLAKIMKMNTMLVVAHRLSTIKNCTKILVLANGVIKEFGSHDELIAKKGIYYQMYKLQFSK